MPFQTTVLADIKSGVIGELAFDGPTRVQTAMLDSGAGAANNVIGRVFTWIDKAANTVQAGGPAADFAGILVHPKGYSSLGTTAGGTLADTLILPDGVAVELLFMGEVYVSLATTGGTIGAALKYNTTTGVIDFGAPGAGEAAIPNAVLSRHNASPTAAGQFLAVAKLTN
jgi:hypothetical protein